MQEAIKLPSTTIFRKILKPKDIITGILNGIRNKLRKVGYEMIFTEDHKRKNLKKEDVLSYYFKCNGSEHFILFEVKLIVTCKLTITYNNVQYDFDTSSSEFSNDIKDVATKISNEIVPLFDEECFNSKKKLIDDAHESGIINQINDNVSKLGVYYMKYRENNMGRNDNSKIKLRKEIYTILEYNNKSPYHFEAIWALPLEPCPDICELREYELGRKNYVAVFKLTSSVLRDRFSIVLHGYHDGYVKEQVYEILKFEDNILKPDDIEKIFNVHNRVKFYDTVDEIFAYAKRYKEIERDF